MQKIIGITGKIGSGKTTVSIMLEKLGAILYNCDIRAKYLMKNDKNVQNIVIKLLGENAYKINGDLNKKWIAKQIFENDEKLNALNNIIHPAVKNDFENFVKNIAVDKKYILYESALLFDKGEEKRFDKVIFVDAPDEICLKRVMKREGCTVEEVKKRMNNQKNDSRKKILCDFVIENTTFEKTKKQVLEIHQKIINS